MRDTDQIQDSVTTEMEVLRMKDSLTVFYLLKKWICQLAMLRNFVKISLMVYLSSRHAIFRLTDVTQFSLIGTRGPSPFM